MKKQLSGMAPARPDFVSDTEYYRRRASGMTAIHLLVGCGLLAAAGTAQAQTGGAAGADEPDPGEIVVTAQRREENLQRVPIAITVVGGDALKSNNFTSITDAQYLAPSLKFTPTPFAQSFSVRGVGSQAFDYSVEQSVGVSLDEVIQTLPRTLSLNTLADVERIEVLRGPQGTLFGKNTSAGLISIITRRPVIGARTLEGHLQYGSRNEVQAYGIVNLPLGEDLALRVRAAYQSRDSFIRNRSTGRIPDSRDYQINGKLFWEPSETFSLYAIGDYQKSFGDPGIWTIRNFGTGGTAPGVGNTFVRTQTSALGIVPGPDNRLVALNGDNFIATESYGGQLTASLVLGSHTLTSITAYKHLDYGFVLDSDSTPLRVLDKNIGSLKAYQATQEIRLASPTGQTIEYVLGGFYYRQKIDAKQQQSGGFGFLPNNFPLEITQFGGLNNYGVRVTNYALFGEVKARLSEKLRLFGGIRYTHDKISSSLFFSDIPGVCGFELLFVGVCHATPLPTPTVSGETKKGAFTGRGGIEFDLAPDVMVYATVSRGYKGAGITTVSGSLTSVRPETVWSEEIGIKSQFLDRKVTLNIAAFHSKYTDFQTQVFDASIPPRGAFLTGNAGGMRSQGIEVEATARPIDNLVLSGGFAYTDAKFTDYQPACYAGQTAAQGCNLPGPTFDASGTRLPNAPKWTYNLALSYETPEFSGIKAFFNSNYAYRSSVIFAVGNPGTYHEGYGIVNMAVGIADPQDRVRLSLFARNLTDKRFASTLFGTLFDTGGYSQILSDQAFRRIGVALDFKF